MLTTPRHTIVFLAALLLLFKGCGDRSADVVLYVALDRAHSAPIVTAFEKATGLRVDAHYDVEATKSVGLRRRIQAEAKRPVCDVFWNNEVVQTVLLAEDGMLAPYVSPMASDIPPSLKDAGGLWTGFAARARVIILNTEKRPDPSQWPAGMADFLDPANRGLCGMARPLTGTTAAHAAYLIHRNGKEALFQLLEGLRDNEVRFGPGNAHLMRLVRGEEEPEFHFGWTDTDDYQVAEEEDFPVTRILPGQQPGGEGLLVIPNTVALIKNAPHPEEAQKLIDFLLSPEVEERLAAGPSVQIPVRDNIPRPGHVLDLSTVKVAEVDWKAAGQAYRKHQDELEAFFIR
ncbi:MAG: extracellular solute-binding protein [Planctomycetota bacterium]|nr:extracellular solute-binding protein [Planctomycetota bacterium]